jgi:hypothetical protein
LWLLINGGVVLRKFFILAYIPILLSACSNNEVKSDNNSEMIYLYSVNGIKVWEDINTGNIVYGSGNKIDVIPYKDLTEKQIEKLKQMGYKDVNK